MIDAHAAANTTNPALSTALGVFAEVAVRMPAYSAAPAVLSYYVPAALQPHIKLGALVWVPVRNEQVQGIVLALAHEPPVDVALRPIADLGDPDVVISSHLIELAHWLHRTYRASLWDALDLLLPPGIDQESQRTWQVTQQGQTVDLGTLPLAERGVLYYVRQHGETTQDTLADELRGTPDRLRKLCLSLHEKKLLQRGVALSRAKARPKYERWATLRFEADQLDETLESVGQSKKRKETLAVLAERVATLGTDDDEQPSVRVQDLPLAPLRELEQRGLIALEQREVLRNPLDGSLIEPDVPPQLSEQQAAALAPVIESIRQHQHQTFLLHGVTGSGKTELYLRAIARALRAGRQALVLVPEIALTAQLVRRFAARFGEQVVVLHSGLSLGERYDTWRRLQRGDARIVVGSRSAVFAPLPDLGLIVVDEEHEPSYKHEEGVRYHARDVAIKLAELTNSAVILGSATPAVESFLHARDGRYTLLRLPDRVGRTASGGTQTLPMPPVRVIDMRVELQNGNRSIFCRALQHALQQTLDGDQQAILFLNRRGAASFVMCRDCGHTLGCPRCSSPLTVHEYHVGASTDELLRCHTCNHRELVPTLCPNCWSKRIRQFGIGTQRVVNDVEALFPGARVLRWDRDTTGRKGAHDRLLQTFLNHEADVVVGTQMIAKGLDLPLVTLVGVVSADVGLNVPDFRAGERTFQLMAQVAGRAGRREGGGQVIIQTYNPDHYALRNAAEHNYLAFWQEEIAFRREAHYPPYSQLVRFVASSPNDDTVRRHAEELAQRIQAALDQLNLRDAAIIGPAPAFMQRVRGRYRWHLVVRAPHVQPLLDLLGPLPGWTVDVDPVNVL